ncbi:hypothetical protein Vadar_002798 [Vaccinium darrowii]|uniref:Uncharacterized protein n=1 Tax=Vaccinium darrowii TaxID=229202 RepID=A0ACB7XMR0_9ERIC|nr:hypothetical protein Vadar_002798 [Vaccinium darrowii]
MGAGGRTSIPPKSTEKAETSVLLRVPHSKPPFTLSEIKKAIPPHCFNRSVLRSFSYLISDLVISTLLYYVATTYIHLLPSMLSSLAWVLYWICQGCVFVGLWMVAHECGHHAFSDYQWLDDTVGLVFHSALLTPYFSWKHSHRRHHSNTASMERDEVYVPKPKSEVLWYYKYLINNPPYLMLNVLITLTMGWPLYLMFNAAGRKYDRFASHFDPYSPIYSNRERAQIYLSDAGVLAVGVVLYKLAAAKGLIWVLCIYGVPLLIQNGFLVVITWLHHTHPALPHYDSSEWDWLRGALSTVDRDYGVLNKVFHNITNTHVAHHLFSTMPHYHAMEATKAIRPILGDYYHYDETPILKAIWRDAKECMYVEPDDGGLEGVLWFNNKF